MSEHTQGRKKALIYLWAPCHVPQGHCDVDVYAESSTLHHKREVIKRKAVELNADIEMEYLTSRQSWPVAGHPLFREMLKVIRRRQIDYVLIYPDRPHRIRERSAVIAEAIKTAGAQIVSAQNLESVPESVKFIMDAFNEFDRFARRDVRL